MNFTFNEIIERLKKVENKKIAVAVAQDAAVLDAIWAAKTENIADAILVGDEDKISECAKSVDMDIQQFEVIHEPDDSLAAQKAVELVSNGDAQMLMKGLLETSTFLRAVLDKEKGLRTGKVLSHVSLFEIAAQNRLLMITDAAMNIAPTLDEKKQIIENAVFIARRLGLELPKVACIAAVEVVNSNMPATIDAAALAKMNDRGQIKNCIVDGPFALDNAISVEAAKHKGVKSPIAGLADIVLVPDIESGNVFYKALSTLASFKVGAMLVGTKAPVILTSRADTPESKLNSIAITALSAFEDPVKSS